MDKDLTTKQKLFVEAYLEEPNGTQAAMKAGYKGNRDTLKQVASENLAKPYIAQRIGERVNSAIMSANEVLEELSLLAKDRDKVRHSDKLKALELTGKYHKLFTDRSEVNVTGDNLAQIIEQRLIDKGWKPDEAQAFVRAEYPEVAELGKVD